MTSDPKAGEGRELASIDHPARSHRALRSTIVSVSAAVVVTLPLASTAFALEPSLSSGSGGSLVTTTTLLGPIDASSESGDPLADAIAAVTDSASDVPIVGDVIAPPPPSSPPPPPPPDDDGDDPADPLPTGAETDPAADGEIDGPDPTSGQAPPKATAPTAAGGATTPRRGPVGVPAIAGDPPVRSEVPATTAPLSDTSTPRVAHRLQTRPDGGLAEDLVRPVSPSSRLRSTASVVGVLRGLDLPPAAVARVLAPFPVAGVATYTSDFGALRHGPGSATRAHEGTDIFAARGTPVIASANGVVSGLTVDRGLAGTSLRLTGRDGSVFFYAHLDRIADGLEERDSVTKGQVLGFVGTTGNAEATAPHLHFEIRPSGKTAVDPVPFLDRWLADAEATASILQSAPSGTLAFGARAGSSEGIGAALRPGRTSSPTGGARSSRSVGATVAAPIEWALQPIAAVTSRVRADWQAVAASIPMLLAVAWRTRTRRRTG